MASLRRFKSNGIDDDDRYASLEEQTHAIRRPVVEKAASLLGAQSLPRNYSVTP